MEWMLEAANPLRRCCSRVLNPVIKWSGSKRLLASTISPLIAQTGVYFEPFVGGGAILGAIGPRRSFASDTVPELIELWTWIKEKPIELADSYEEMWLDLQKQGHEFYYHVRSEFNKTRRADYFLFLTRTCVNGLIRFNSSGNFNNSLHHSRPGIAPHRLRQIIAEWSERVSMTEFLATDFTHTLAEARSGDIAYLDPPYMGNKGRYAKQEFDFPRFWDVLSDLNARSVLWVLSLDGTAGDRDYSLDLAIPRKLSKCELKVAAGKSPFPRLLNSRLDEVTESIFTNFDIHGR